MQISQITPTLNNSRNQIKKDFVTPNYTNINFSGAPALTQASSKFFVPIKTFFKPMNDAGKKVMDKATTFMAKGIGKFLDIKPVESFINLTKNSENLVAHCTAFTAVVLSGFYIKQTLENEKLDPQKRKTLAINQGATTVLSTFLSYTLCKVLDKKINAFTTKFGEKNKAIGLESLDNIEQYKRGIKGASQIMIFMTIYRFIAPVLVTPLANKLGNRLQEKKEAELVGKK